ncbi:hypothetical protein P7C73_g4493, partial [Tremellales sp. Uapishka_1]
MSLRTSLLPSLLHHTPLQRPAAAKRFFHFLPSSSSVPKPRSLLRDVHDSHVRTRPVTATSNPRNVLLYSTVGLGLTFAGYNLFSPSRQVHCDSPFATTRGPEVGGGNPPPESILSVYELGFGSVCGVCSGVFLKKGLKAIAFLLGGVFVLLQYLSSTSILTVDWARLSSKYDSIFGTKTATGTRAPTVKGVYAWAVDFLTANFQQRASFLAGLALGFRLG